MVEPERSGSWRTMGRFIPFLAGLVAFFALSAAVTWVARPDTLSPRMDQPIAFNHQLHVEEQELGCDTCHTGFADQIQSGLPDAEICSMCHSEPMGESPEEARLVRMLEEGKPLLWNSLFRQPPHVFFSHRAHVTAASLPCEGCHGGIGRSQTPPRRVRRLAMEDCIDCHRERQVQADCTTCHR